MRTLYSKLINIPVYTVKNNFLGKVCDFEIDIDTYTIIKIHVKSNNIIQGLFKDVLIISQMQIIKITTEKIIVDDAVIKQKNKKQLNIKLSEKKETATVTTSEIK